jgi:hypothetical protein
MICNSVVPLINGSSCLLTTSGGCSHLMCTKQKQQNKAFEVLAKENAESSHNNTDLKHLIAQKTGKLYLEVVQSTGRSLRSTVESHFVKID